MAFALPKRLERSGKGAAAGHLVLRAVILFFVGVIYSGGAKDGWDQVRWLGVLQRIALGSVGAGLLSLWLSPRGLVVALAAILAGYWALMTFVPVHGLGAGHFAEGQNLANYLDRTYLPGRKYDGDHDPEGILSTLPAIATGILGILAGRWLKGTVSPSSKILGLVMTGTLMLVLGWLWHAQFPLVKKLWTSSFVLVAGGWSAILLGLFYGVVDVLKIKFWTPPFVWVGSNPILLYFCSGLAFFRIIAIRITGSHTDDWMPELVAFALMLLVARFLYRRGIYVRA
jgi:predicted acyltransferase